MSFNGRVGPLTIATDGLVGCWDAAAQRSYPGSGTLWKDISGQGNDATANNSPAFVNQNGGYWNFDGINEYFTYDLYSGFDNAYIQAIDISIEVWVRIEDLTSCCGAYWAFGTAYFEMAPSSNTTNLYVRTGSPAWNAVSGGTNTDQWYCYTMTHGVGTTYKVYIDGILNSTFTIGGTNIQFTHGTGSFGTNDPTSPLCLDGDIAVVRMYNRVLTASEVKQNYNSTKGRFA